VKPLPDTGPVPAADFLRAVAGYHRDQALASHPSKRAAARAIARLKMACYELRGAIEHLPDELQTFDVGPLYRAAGEIAAEASWRLHRLDRRRRVEPTEARTRLENQLAILLAQHGARITTYDPRLHENRMGGRGRGGQMAKLLLAAYSFAGIRAPSDLRPILRRLRDREAAHRAPRPRAGVQSRRGPGGRVRLPVLEG